MISECRCRIAIASFDYLTSSGLSGISMRDGRTV